jgi:hypothetical protein
MGAEGVVSHQLFGHGSGRVGLDPTRDIDTRQLVQLGLRRSGQFGRLSGQIGLLRIGLGADRDIFASGHGHGAGDQSGDARNHNRALRGLGGGDADDQACSGDEAVVSPKDSGSQPADTLD